MERMNLDKEAKAAFEAWRKCRQKPIRKLYEEWYKVAAAVLKAHGTKNRNNLALARKIVSAITTNYNDEHAVRLQMRGPNEKDLGGMCITALVGEVHTVLKHNGRARAIKPLKKKPLARPPAGATLPPT